MTHPSRRRRAIVLLLALVGLPAVAQDGEAPPADGAVPGSSAPTPLSVQVEPAPAPAQDHDPAALAVLEAAEAAVASLNSFRCSIECMGQGVFQPTSVRGTIRAIGRRSPEDHDRWQLRLTGSITPERATDPIDIDASFDGQRLRYADPEERTIGARILPVRIMRPFFMVPVGLRDDRLWIHKIPGDLLRSASKLSLEARETIDGVECEVLRADMPSNIEYYRLFVGVEDHLPRRHMRGFDSRGAAQSLPMTGHERTDYKGLEVNPEIADTDLALVVPEGWTDSKFPDEFVQPVTPVIPPGTTAVNEDGSEGHAGASPTGEDESASPSGEEPVRPVGAASAQRVMAEDFTIADRAGASVQLSKMRGQSVVIVFWGSWNPWARDLLAQVAPVVAQEGDGARLLVLGIRERSRDTAVERYEQQGAPGTLCPAGDDVAAKYQIGAIPTVVVVGPTGEVLLRETGAARLNDLPERVRDLLAGR